MPPAANCCLLPKLAGACSYPLPPDTTCWHLKQPVTTYTETCSNVLLSVATWCQLMSTDATWCHLMPPDAIWCHLMPPDATWCYLMPSDATWCHLMPPDATWCHLMPPDATWCRLMSPAATTYGQSVPNNCRLRKQLNRIHLQRSFQSFKWASVLAENAITRTVYHQTLQYERP